MEEELDKKFIQKVIQIYFDSMFESSKEKVEQSFHPNAIIAGVFGEKFVEMNRDAFGKFVQKNLPSAKANDEEPKLEIVRIEIAGDTAVALVRDDYLGLTFLDTLSLVKVEKKWVIYNKLFHIEGDAQ